MKDSEARGLVLKRLYDIRREVEYADAKDFEGIPIEPKVIPNIVEQLAQQKLVTWNPLKLHGGYAALMAKITVFGSDVIEGNIESPITITVDSSVNVHGSQNVQVGGQGNVQTVTMDIDKMISAVDGSSDVTEKAEAKSLLQKIAGNKLVQEIIRKYLLGSQH
jgi:hypothetical protein